MIDLMKSEVYKRPLYWTSVIVLVISLLFLAVPEVDVWISYIFADAHNAFWMKHEWFPWRLRALGIVAPRYIIATIILFALARLFWPQLKRIFPMSHVLFLLISATLGPGLLVNGLLKNFWGRARPVQVDTFGGTEPFSQVWVMAHSCASNCSFVSGEASISFWMLLLIILLPKEWRKVGLAILAVYATVISVNRIAFGGHFLSDVLLSWALTAWVVVVLSALFRHAAKRGLDNDRLEILWDRAGAWLRQKSSTLYRAAQSRLRVKPQDSAGKHL